MMTEGLNPTLGIILMIVVGVIIFMFLVIIHEFGHFIAAKKSGVKVLEFGIGIPPKACKLRTDKSGTEYTLNRIPLGGFVRLKGEDPSHKEDFNAKDSLMSVSIIKKMIIIFAGITMNLIFARLIFTVIFRVGTKPISTIPENAISIENTSFLTPTVSFLEKNGFISGDVNQPVVVLNVFTGGLGNKIGLESGSIILSINNVNVSLLNLGKVLKDNINKSGIIEYQKNNEKFSTGFDCGNDNCQLDILIGGVDTKTIKFPLNKAIVVGFQEIKSQTKLTLSALGKIGKGLFSFNRNKVKNSVKKLSGPVGITKIIGTLFIEKERTKLLGLAGLISFALAIFNVLPIPALDGGRGLSMLIQWIGRFRPEKYFNIEGYINLVFFVLLMGLGVYIMLKDLVSMRAVKIPFIG